MIQNVIVLFIIAVVVAGAIAKIIDDKKKGSRCSGCPYSKDCTSGGCSK